MHYLDHQLRTAVRREVDLLGGQQPAGWAPGTAERLLNTHLPSNEEVLGLQLARLSMPDPSIVARASVCVRASCACGSITIYKRHARRV
eukprot:scaffold92837_cov20-Tisochrysis_lutea.AAC.2